MASLLRILRTANSRIYWIAVIAIFTFTIQSYAAAPSSSPSTTPTPPAATLPVCTIDGPDCDLKGKTTTSEGNSEHESGKNKKPKSKSKTDKKSSATDLKASGPGQVSPGWHRMTAEDMVKAAQAACLEDTKTHCKDVKNGDGRIARCLKEHEAVLKPDCRQFVGTS